MSEAATSRAFVHGGDWHEEQQTSDSLHR